MQITILGTTCMVPTKERAHSAIMLRYEAEGLLFDCGENTQRQLKQADISPTAVTRIFISHWHGDHALGVPGLVSSLGTSNYQGVLRIYGPSGTKENIKKLMQIFHSRMKLEYEVIEIDKRVIVETPDFYVEALKLKHAVDCYGFSFVEKDKRKIKVEYVKKLGIPDGPLLGELQKGKTIVWKGKKVLPKEATSVVKGRKMTYIPDTVFCKNCIELAKDADVLICESSYTSALEEKATEYMHLTAKQAANIANLAGAKRLILTHISPRYKDVSEVEEDAKELFKDTVCAFDFMKIKM